MMKETEAVEMQHAPKGDIKVSISAYAQAEKVKSGLIWICQVADLVAAMEGLGRQQGLSVLQTLAGMVADESQLAGKITGNHRWFEIGQKINMALVMINSGVPQETGFHLAQALSKVTHIGNQAAAVLKENDLF
jgi:hypothetical protein